MRKLTECLIVLAFLLCAFTVQAASEIDVSIPSAGEPCSNDLDCGPGELCISNICSAARPCTDDLQCDPGELCVDNICKQGGCLNNEDCEEGLICDNDRCVECITWTDCDNETEICSDENMCVLADDCDLQIKPKIFKINKDRKTTYKAFKLTVKGNENFYPFRVDPVTGEPVINPSSGKPFRDTTVTPLEIKGKTYRWKQERRVLEEVVGVNTDQESGSYTLRFGKCLGQIEVINPNE